MNKNVYPKINDEKLLELVSNFRYVPYKVNKYTKHEVGHTYYDNYWHEVYTVLGITDEGKVKIEWEDGRLALHRAKLDKKDFELKPFETKFGIGIPVFNERCSYSAAEIKALIYAGVITDEEIVDVLINEYFVATHVPNDYNYYFIKTPKINGERQIKLKRDLKRCPHNFYNIKTLEDLYKDQRIALYEFVDKDGETVIPEEYGIPAFIYVLNIEHITGAKYRITLNV